MVFARRACGTSYMSHNQRDLVSDQEYRHQDQDDGEDGDYDGGEGGEAVEEG